MNRVEPDSLEKRMKKFVKIHEAGKFWQENFNRFVSELASQARNMKLKGWISVNKKISTQRNESKRKEETADGKENAETTN